MDATKEQKLLAQLHQSGDYSDLIVSCGELSLKVHKAIVCSKSKFFANACKPGYFKEGLEGVVNLGSLREDISGDGNTSKDDPEMVQKMICFMYLDRYDKVGPERPLVLHARMYLMGDKYQCEDLVDKALENLRQDVAPECSQLDVDDLFQAIYIAFNATSEQADKLEKCVAQIFCRNSVKLKTHPKVESTIMDFPRLARAVWREFTSPSSEPTCRVCNDSHTGYSPTFTLGPKTPYKGLFDA